MCAPGATGMAGGAWRRLDPGEGEGSARAGPAEEGKKERWERVPMWVEDESPGFSARSVGPAPRRRAKVRASL